MVPPSPTPRTSAASLGAAAQRRGKARTRKTGDVMSGSYGSNRGRPLKVVGPHDVPGQIPGTRTRENPRSGQNFEIGLTSDGRIVHLYHRPGQAPQRVVLSNAPRQRVPQTAPPVLGTNGRRPTIAPAKRRARRVTYGNAGSPTTP